MAKPEKYGIDGRLWGKLPQNSDKKLCLDDIHSLVCHCLDVGTVFLELWNRFVDPNLKEWMRKAFGAPDVKTLGQWLAFIAADHDIGKATPAFQIARTKDISLSIYKALIKAGYEVEGARSDHYHNICSQYILFESDLIKKLFHNNIDDNKRFCSLEYCVPAIGGAHHGTVADFFCDGSGILRSLGHNSKKSKKWKSQQDSIIEYLAQHFNVKKIQQISFPKGEDQSALLMFSGLLSTSDWIASSPKTFSEENYSGCNFDLDEYVLKLPQLVKKAVDKSGLIVDKMDIKSSVSFKDIFKNARGTSLKPNAMQRCIDSSIDIKDKPFFVAIESETGSGKTEAALNLAIQGMKKNGHRGIYYGLPTMATSNAMLSRFIKPIENICGEKFSESIKLLHSSAKSYLDIAQQTNKDIKNLRFEWTNSNAKLKVISPFGIGTIDQSLLSIIKSRYFFMRLMGLAGKVVIFDEVHAYDVFTTSLIKHAIKWLKAMKCSIIIASATLPTQSLIDLIESWTGKQSVEVKDCYPRITFISGNDIISKKLPVSLKRKYMLRTVQRNDEAIARSMLYSIKEGGCIAYICNRVRRANAIYRMLKSRIDPDTEIILLHAKMPKPWRLKIEVDIEKKFGKKGWRRKKGIFINPDRPKKSIVIATQVIEQSLDLDFDAMWSDLAPIDLLLQRLGRVHRHSWILRNRELRPRFLRNPKFYIVTNKVSPYDIPTFGNDSLIYNTDILLRTYVHLVRPGKGRTSITIPNDVQNLVDSVYSGYTPTYLTNIWKEKLEETKKRLDIIQKKHKIDAKSHMIPSLGRKNIFLDLYTENELKKTRNATSVDHDEVEKDISDLMSNVDGLSADGLGIKKGSNWNLSDAIECALTRKMVPNVSIICYQRDGDLCRIACTDKFFDFKNMSNDDINAICEHSVSLIHRAVRTALKQDMPTEDHPWGDIKRLCYIYPVRVDNKGMANISGVPIAISREFGLESGRRNLG